jgi:transcriptional regulator GlxA family with amidase domain
MTNTRKVNGPIHQIIRGKGWTLVEVAAKQRDIDAANGLPLNGQNTADSRQTIESMHQHIREKGWTLAEIGARWGVVERQMSRIVKASKTRYLDAATGLPHKEKPE